MSTKPDHFLRNGLIAVVALAFTCVLGLVWLHHIVQEQKKECHDMGGYSYRSLCIDKDVVLHDR